MTVDEASKALDEGRLEVAVANGRWWALRRNGKTHVPKRLPDAWHIPTKYGLRGYMRVDASDFDNGFVRIKP